MKKSMMTNGSIRKLATLASALLLAGKASANDVEIAQIARETGVQHGQGFNSVSLRTLGICLKPEPVFAPSGAASVETYAHRATTKRELFEFLSGEIEAKSILNTPFTPHGSLELFASTQLTSTSTYVVARVKVRQETQTLSEHRFADLFVRHLRISDPEQFFRKCGDRFVHGITGGGDLILVLRFHHETELDRLAIEAEIDVGIGPIRTTAELVAGVKKWRERTTLTYTVLRRGGILPIPNDLDGLLDYLEAFPNDAAQNPARVSVQLKGYEVVDGAPGEDLFLERRYVAELGERQNAANDRTDERESVIADPWQFDPAADLDRVARDIALLRVYARELEASYYRCVAGLPNDCQTHEFPAEPVIEDVPRRFIVTKLWRNGGTPPWCWGSVSPRPLPTCSSSPIGYAVGFVGRDDATGLPVVEPSPLTQQGMYNDAKRLWTNEGKGPLMGFTLNVPAGQPLLSCTDGPSFLGRNRVVTRKVDCGYGPAEEIGFSFMPSVQ